MDITKEATFAELMTAPIAVQLAAAILGTGLMAADSEHVEELRSEADAMNQALRVHEAEKMRQTTRSLDSKYASAEAETLRLVKIAAAMTVAGDDLEKLAHLLELQGMDKEAIGALIGGLARGAGAALRGLGGAASAAARLKVPGTPAAPAALQRAGNWVGQQGQAMQNAGTRLGALGAKAAPAAAAAAPAAQGAAKSKPLIGWGTKGKLLAAGGLAGAGYVGMKGMQAARDYMMAPSGHAGAPIQHDVNQFGYPQY